MNKFDRPKIAVFDSGVGGISIINHLQKTFPILDIVFLCDDVMFPYGAKQDSELLERVPSLVAQFVALEKPKLVVIACNTASTVCL